MARIQTRKGKNRTTFTATVRVKGFTPLARTFDTKGEAKSWAADVEKEMRMGRYQDARPAENLTFAEVETSGKTKKPTVDSGKHM